MGKDRSLILIIVLCKGKIKDPLQIYPCKILLCITHFIYDRLNYFQHGHFLSFANDNKEKEMHNEVLEF